LQILGTPAARDGGRNIVLHTLQRRGKFWSYNSEVTERFIEYVV
jgi:hypothetical protein